MKNNEGKKNTPNRKVKKNTPTQYKLKLKHNFLYIAV